MSISDHYERAVGRLSAQLRDIPEVLALIRAKCRQTQDLEDAIAGLLAVLGVDNAPLPLLKLYAKVVGLIPGSRAVDSLRHILKATVKLNRSSGTVPELIDIVSLLLPDTATVSVAEGIAEIAVRLADCIPDADTLADISSIVRRAKVGGVRAFLEWATATDSGTFILSDSTGLTATLGLGLGDSTDASIGGALAGASIT